MPLEAEGASTPWAPGGKVASVGHGLTVRHHDVCALGPSSGGEAEPSLRGGVPAKQGDRREWPVWTGGGASVSTWVQLRGVTDGSV